MTHISINLNDASTEQYAAQILLIVRENAETRPAGDYYPGCLESILQFEFSPSALGLDVRGGVLRQSGGAVSSYGGDRPPDWLRQKFGEAVNWLRQRGYLVRDHSQSNDQFVEATSEGRRVEIDTLTMKFLIPRNWTEWHRQYSGLVFHTSTELATKMASGTAFLFGHRRFGTCAHNFQGPLVVYICGQEVEAIDVIKNDISDVASFTIPEPVALPSETLPVSTTLPEPGSEVAAMGFPAVPLRQPTLGIYIGSVEAVPTDYSGASQFIQVSFQTAGGNSGGPVFDQLGRIVGIVSEKTFEQVVDHRVAARAFSQVTPIARLFEIGPV
ncbi:S1 family peptidase [Lignipirellula cremea]|uniref:Serine protease n=1 Tax=Lignipirellula cremea TaxID=2528010 RepID=A0A518DQI8_9BACT|nr:serine protease [Lignipirellula cremea]QDU94107.1 hypothetical protein Pla8534_18930 [Lignipirellula cremea]